MNSIIDDDDLPEPIPLGPPLATADAAGAEQHAPRPPVPVTLITGFLGAGKTTLVRHILTARHGRRVAVILNEFGGEGDIERAFVRDEAGATAAVPQWVELANGCLCCSVKAEFLQALEALVSPGSAHEGKFDAVLIETTGLANPGPIIGELWSDEELEPAVTLDGVVTVVDAANVYRQLAERRAGGAPNEAQLQVAMADVVLLNKIDLVSEDHLEEAEARLRTINAAATLVRCSRSAVDPAVLFGRGAYRLRGADGAPLAGAEGEAAAAAGHDGGGFRWEAEGQRAGAAGGAAGGCSGEGCSDPSHEHHAEGGAPLCESHDTSIRTVALRCEVPVCMGKFTAWVEGLLWERWGAGGHQQPGGQGQQQGQQEQREQEQVQRRGQQQQPQAGRPGHLPGSGNGDGGGGESGSGGSNGGDDGGGGDDGRGGAPPLPEVLRLKGLVDIGGSGNAHMVQAVYEVYDIVEGPPWEKLEQQWAEEYQQRQQQQPGIGGTAEGATGHTRPARDQVGRATRLVAIGRHLHRAALQRGLEGCAA